MACAGSPDGGGKVMMPSIMTGLLAISLGLWGLSAWWWSVVEVLRGVLPVALIFFGVIALAAGVSGLRRQQADRDADLPGVDE